MASQTITLPAANYSATSTTRAWTGLDISIDAGLRNDSNSALSLNSLTISRSGSGRVSVDMRFTGGDLNGNFEANGGFTIAWSTLSATAFMADSGESTAPYAFTPRNLRTHPNGGNVENEFVTFFNGLPSSNANASLTLIDTSPNPVLISINDVTVSEGDGAARLHVTVTEFTTDTINVRFRTADGTALMQSSAVNMGVPPDFGDTTGNIAFDRGETSKRISIGIRDDTNVESTETFTVILHTPRVFYGDEPELTVEHGFEFTKHIGTVTILDDDSAAPAPPIISINSTLVREDIGMATLTVSMNKASTDAVTFDYATRDGTAVAGTDYTQIAATTGTIAAGETSLDIDITILTDNAVESDEHFFVDISNPMNATISPTGGMGRVTITEQQVSIVGGVIVIPPLDIGDCGVYTKEKVIQAAGSLLGHKVLAREQVSTTSVEPLSRHGLLWVDDVAKELLTMHPWTFATKRLALTASSLAATYYEEDWTNSYVFPEDALRIQYILDPRTATTEELVTNTPFAIERADAALTKVILCSVPNAQAVYTSDMDLCDTGTAAEIGARWEALPPHFVQPLIILLASKLAFAITRNLNVMQQLSNYFFSVFPSYVAQDVDQVVSKIQESSQPIQHNPYAGATSGNQGANN